MEDNNDKGVKILATALISLFVFFGGMTWGLAMEFRAVQKENTKRIDSLERSVEKIIAQTTVSLQYIQENISEIKGLVQEHVSPKR